LLRQRTRRRAADPDVLERVAFKAFTNACAKADAPRIRSTLDQWLMTHYAAPLPQATAQFMRAAPAREALNALNRALYQNHLGGRPDVDALRACVQACRAARAHPAQRALELPALYPSP